MRSLLLTRQVPRQREVPVLDLAEEVGHVFVVEREGAA